MVVKDIVSKYLKDNGYEGLFNESEDCGCELSDLMPCDEPRPDCEPGFKMVCESNCGDHYFHVGIPE